MGKGHLIDNHWVEGAGKAFHSTNPSDGKVGWEGREATSEELSHALKAARGAFEKSSNSALGDRISLLTRFAEKLTERKAELSETISRETGKPIWESLSEVDSMIGKIPASIEAYHERRKTTERAIGDARGMTRYRPFGVVAVLGPFNMPGHLPNGHIVPAILAGNTVVFKPSEMTPGVAERTMEIWVEAGLPAGAINMVQGGGEVGGSLVKNWQVNGVFFTGSLRAGRAIELALLDPLAEKGVQAGNEKGLVAGCEHGTMLALEMGGNNPLIVHNVSNIDAAVLMTIQSAYLSAGQRCTCSRRLIVPFGMGNGPFVKRLIEAIPKIKVGLPGDVPEPFMGPVISELAATTLLQAQSNMIKNGCKAHVPMRVLGPKTLLSPGLIETSGAKGHIQDAEYFGPLLQLIFVHSFEAAIDYANGTKYGLAAGLLSDDPALYEMFSKRIRAGVVNWNRPLTGASGYLPFGGVKCSGNHRPSGYFAADYCSYPVASVEAGKLEMPAKLPPGIGL